MRNGKDKEKRKEERGREERIEDIFIDEDEHEGIQEQ